LADLLEGLLEGPSTGPDCIGSTLRPFRLLRLLLSRLRDLIYNLFIYINI
jgi:hypothetical protein